MQIKEFSCMRDSFVIRGLEYVDEPYVNVQDKPVAIISHGFMANQQTTKKYALLFAKQGYAAYTFDFVGGCLKGKSDGSLASDMTVLTEVEDLKAVISYVKECCSAYTNPQRLTLMGCSQGGVISALTAGALPEEIERLMLFYPAFCIPEDSYSGQMVMFKFDPNNIPDQIKGIGRAKLNGDYVRQAQHLDILATAVKYKGPVLIVHGTGDKLVNCRYSEEAVKAYRDAREADADINKNVELVLLDGAGHNFGGMADSAAQQMLERFIRGKKVVLTVYVRLKGHSFRQKGKNWVLTLPFDGPSESAYFKGEVAPGGADVQERFLLKAVQYRADYHLVGTDFTGKETDIHIVNVFRDGVWTPTITTDSEALSFLNDGTCEAVLENHGKGPIVRIWH